MLLPVIPGSHRVWWGYAFTNPLLHFVTLSQLMLRMPNHIYAFKHTIDILYIPTYPIYTHPNPQVCTNENSDCWADSEKFGTEKALHSHIQAYGMWTHWWAHTYGTGGFCCISWEEGAVLAFDRTPNHRAQHTKYCLKISNCLGCIILSHYKKTKQNVSLCFLFSLENKTYCCLQQ